MNEEEKERRWKEMVDRGGVESRELKGGWRGELVTDLKLLVILLVVWISFFSIIEITGL